MPAILKITDVFEIDVLQKIQDEFSNATGLAAVTVDYRGTPVTKYSNFTEFCQKVRCYKNALECCLHSDAHGGIESAKKGKPSVYICHAGLVDLAVPIMVKGHYLGAILSGQIRIPKKEMDKLPYGVALGITEFDDPEISNLYNKTAMRSYKQVMASANLLYTIANHLVEKKIIQMMQDELHNKNLELMEQVKLRSQMETALKEAELHALESQINPHFLFNVLNTIGRPALIENAEKTQEMIYSFSDLMRYTLKKGNNHFVTIKEAIDHIRNCLSIQKMRMGDRLTYEIDLDEEISDYICPFMTIYPFVENAIKHAVEPSLSGGKIMIKAKKKNELAYITIEDNGKGILKENIGMIIEGKYYTEEKEMPRTSTGIGVDNANKRLKYFYGEEYGIQMKSEVGKGTKIILRIPKQTLLGRG